MLRNFIKVDAPQISAGLAHHQKFHPKDGAWIINPSDLISLNLNVRFSHLVSRFPLTCNFSGNCMMLSMEPKRNLRKYSTCLAKLPGKNEPEAEEYFWKFWAYYDALDSAPWNFLSKLLPKSPPFKTGEQGCDSKKDPSCLPFYGQEIPEHLVLDNQVNLLEKLNAIHLHLLGSEQWNSSQLKLCHRYYLVNAINLTHYLTLRGLDTEQLMEVFSFIGFLNLESINSCILPSLRAGIQLLESRAPNNVSSKENLSCHHMFRRDYITAQESEKLRGLTISDMRENVYLHAEALFGPAQSKKPAHVMVTVGREAASNESLLTELLKAGANVIRINCAHDDQSVWSDIIRMAKHSSQKLSKPCRILMDLAGPKLRVSPLKTDADVIKVSPKNDAIDAVLPAQVWLCCAGSSPPAHVSPDATVSLDQKFLSILNVGDVLRFVDARGKKRAAKILMKSPLHPNSGYMVLSLVTAYIGVGTKFYVEKKNEKISVGEVVSVEKYNRLKVGDLITICRDSCLQTDQPGATAFGSTRITCSSDHIFDFVKTGEPIAFSDGKIWGKIQGTDTNEITVLITHASPYGSKLSPGRSINIPKSEVRFKGLTPKDIVDLEFVAANADMVGISFVRDVHDVVDVQRQLQKRKLDKLGMVLKVETREAFEKLPLLLFQAMQSPNPLGVMIARGDLMVECGWHEMADIQEQILSFCNAAHIPVIWATQVLESLVKNGLPTRAEITDLASGMRASCIMLNKGEHIVEAVSELASIISKYHTKNMETVQDPLFPSSYLNQ